MANFFANPSVLYIETRVKSQYTVHLNYTPLGYAYYANRALDLPPNVSVGLQADQGPNNLLAVPIIIITYDPTQSGRVASGKYTSRIEMNSRGPQEPKYINLDFCFLEGKQEEETEEKTTSSLLECGVCCHDFDDKDHVPKMLSCGHTFCWQCILKIEREHNSMNMFGRPAYACPFDRSEIHLPACMLPKNRLVLDLIEEKKQEELRKSLLAPLLVEDPDVPCYENDRHESEVYCEDCKESFCNSCYGSVHSSKMLSKHTNIPVTERPLVIPMCPLHQETQAEFVCQDENCQSLSCSDCVSDHQFHRYIALETHMSSNIGFLKVVVDKLKSEEKTLATRIENNEKCAASFKQNSDGVQKLIDEIDQHFESKRFAAVQKLKRWAAEKEYDLNVERADSERILSDIQEFRKKAEQTLNRKTELHTNLEMFKGFDSEEGIIPRADHDHYFALNEHTFSPEMVEPPSSPIVLSESAPPSPTQSPAPTSPPPPIAKSKEASSTPPPSKIARTRKRKAMKPEINPILDKMYNLTKVIDGDRDEEVVGEVDVEAQDFSVENLKKRAQDFQNRAQLVDN
ncbi:hypothetical protein CAEBREN_12231 [Caenorhabditis brenneri]|uniref:RING-type domain-containing protein n=1 Tax=Caenorhabditis brenneri TaxID=135651 RepID=G0NC12_CAEBE|nr:hypothetical protein CAEBREN_12231 [Caenorhabditis brenneri]